MKDEKEYSSDYEKFALESLEAKANSSYFLDIKSSRTLLLEMFDLQEELKQKSVAMKKALEKGDPIFGTLTEKEWKIIFIVLVNAIGDTKYPESDRKAAQALCHKLNKIKAIRAINYCGDVFSDPNGNQ